ncbi:enoyl-CoA hydratase/isomerase family protein [Aliiroseovarius crassostreae]|uniref:enoyl-CoA hydratase/isomerase family protein n=1 Tax=Aliiroseovarius crassostreae TaxID=154981 RepID=UPI003C7A8C97
MSADCLTLDLSEGVASLCLNRPTASNALNMDLCDALKHAAEACANDPAVRVICIFAKGDRFCVGGDLEEVSRTHDRGRHLATLASVFHEAIACMDAQDAPIIVAVDGVAAGAGLSLALTADVLLASPRAKFVSAYSQIGYSPDGGLTHVLPRIVGTLRARELLLTNRVLDAQTALDWGLVSKVVAADHLAKEAEALSRTLASGPARTHAAIRRLVRESPGWSLRHQLSEEAASIAALAGSPDGIEGVDAFLENRKPSFAVG